MIRTRMLRAGCAAMLAAGLCAVARAADKVELTDGNTLTGTIGEVGGGTMKFHSDSLGDLSIDLTKVKNFTTDSPARIRVKNAGFVTGPITAGDATKVTVNGRDVPMETIRLINPPAAQWTGSIVATGLLANGNSHEMSIGVDAAASVRRDTEELNDRFSLAGAYHFGRQRDRGTGITSTTTDDWFASIKYDKFFTDQFYGYGNFRYDHDRLAALQYRLTPGVGVGYQWVERPDFNLSTEGGVSYVYEEYSNDGNDDHVALRLAYHVDRSFFKDDAVKLFHNLEYLPAIDDPGDYNLNTDAGVRTKLTKTMFAELKAEWRRDSTPAPNALKNDLRFLLGVGWTF
jgi:putative salt-induced outer membrane protein YdiY